MKIGAWGIKERQSGYVLDLLVTIAATQMKAVDFAIFHIADAIKVIKVDIMEEIRKRA